MDIRFEDIVNGTSLETIFKKRKESVDKANAKLNKKINKITFESEGEKELFREVNLKGFDDNNYICFFANKEDLFPNFNLFKETALKLLNINKELSKELAIVISKSFTSNDSEAWFMCLKTLMI